MILDWEMGGRDSEIARLPLLGEGTSPLRARVRLIVLRKNGGGFAVGTLSRSLFIPLILRYQDFYRTRCPLA